MKRGSIIFAVVSVVISAAALLILWKFLSLLQGSVTVSTSDIADYGRWDLPSRYSTLLTFPSQLPPSAGEVVYRYRYADGGGRPMCQIFLSCALSEEDFAAEQARLDGLSFETDGVTRAVRRDGESFLWPAWVAIAGYDFCYEYAMADQANSTMVYIYAMNTVQKDVDFETTYLPSYYMEDFEDLGVDHLDLYTMYGGYSERKLGATAAPQPSGS